MARALITGITGQIGSYLAELLLEKGYEVHGIIRAETQDNLKKLWRIQHIADKLTLHAGNLTDEVFLAQCVKESDPDELYHLASIVDPRIIFENEEEIFAINFQVAYSLLRIVKEHAPQAKFFHAGSSLMFGAITSSPQNEQTPFKPTTPYGIAKTAAHHFVQMYRESYDMFACTGYFFNFESVRRDEFFLPRKITQSVAKIKMGLEKELPLGNIDSQRDWGFAGDAAEAAWLMLQAQTPEDFVIGAGDPHSVRDILDIAFGYVQLEWEDYVIKDERYWRPLEPSVFVADNSKAQKELNWSPTKPFKQLIEEMVENDLTLLKQ